LTNKNIQEFIRVFDPPGFTKPGPGSNEDLTTSAACRSIYVSN